MQHSFVIPLNAVARKIAEQLPIELPKKEEPKARCTGKLSCEDIDCIRALLKLKCSNADIGKLFKVRPTVIFHIKMNEIHDKYTSPYQLNNFEILAFNHDKFFLWLEENSSQLENKIEKSSLDEATKLLLKFKLNEGVKSLSY